MEDSCGLPEDLFFPDSLLNAQDAHISMTTFDNTGLFTAENTDLYDVSFSDNGTGVTQNLDPTSMYKKIMIII